MEITQKELITFLNELAKKYNLVKVALESCKEIIHSDEVDIEEYYSSSKLIDRNIFNKKDIKLEFRYHTLRFDDTFHNCKEFPFIETKIEMFTNQTILDGKEYLTEIGYYLLITDLNGEITDDFFVLK